MSRAVIGWWNTSLSPPIQATPHITPGKWTVACEVVFQILVERVPLDILALGEVTETIVKDLLASFGGEQKYGYVVDASRHVAVLFDAARVVAGARTAVTALPFNIPTNAGLWVDVEIDGLPLALVASHWPSRRWNPAKEFRTACGGALQSQFRRAREADENAPVLIVGDFNDEPFDDSLTSNLYGTRDRSKARGNADLFYNPFWRMLGESHPLGIESAATFAGSHFAAIHPGTDWHTFDQALVSSSLLRGQGWTLVEDSTAILGVERLRTKSRGFTRKFDHLPIVVMLDYCTAPLQPSGLVAVEEEEAE